MDVGEFLELVNSGERDDVLRYAESIPRHLRDALAEAVVYEAQPYLDEGNYEMALYYLEITAALAIDRMLKSAIPRIMAKSYNNWGNSLSRLSTLVDERSEKKKLLEESCRKYEKAVGEDLHYAKAYSHWGTCLFQLSILEGEHDEKKKLLEESCRKYEKATKIIPDYAEAYANHGLVLLFSNRDLDTAEELFAKASKMPYGRGARKVAAFIEWTRARRHMDNREWHTFREKMEETRKIFEEIDNSLKELVSASISFSYIDEELEKTLREPSALQALARLTEILQHLPEMGTEAEPERTIYGARIASFSVLGSFINALVRVDGNTNLLQLKNILDELLEASHGIEEDCESVNFSPGKSVIVDIASIIEKDGLTLVENLKSAPANLRKSIVNDELEELWNRISRAAQLLNGSYSLEVENVVISKQLHLMWSQLAEHGKNSIQYRKHKKKPFN